MSQQPQAMKVGADTAALQALDDMIISLATTAHTCGVMLDDWAPEYQRELWTKVDSFVSGLQKQEDEAKKQENSAYFIPVDVLKRVDEASNPTIYTRASQDEITNRNDKFRGNMAAIEILREGLDVGLAAWEQEEQESETQAQAHLQSIVENMKDIMEE